MKNPYFTKDGLVEETLCLGAWGYVLKTRAGSDLLLAVEAVLSAKRFVSSDPEKQFVEARMDYLPDHCNFRIRYNPDRPSEAVVMSKLQL